MYEIFSKSAIIDDRLISICILPEFRFYVTTCTEENKERFFSDKEIHFIDVHYKNHYGVCPSMDATWLLEDLSQGEYMLYVTEKAREINTSFGENVNYKLTRFLMDSKREYYKSKHSNLYLYVYYRNTRRLALCGKNKALDGSDVQYSLSRMHTIKSIVDKEFEEPLCDCFMIGKVVRTIGSKKDGKHIDFVEPVYQIKFGKHLMALTEYDRKMEIRYFSDMILLLMRFLIKKEYQEDGSLRRVREYLEKEKGIEATVLKVSTDEAVKMFKAEVEAVMERGDLYQLLVLCDVVCI